MDPERLEQYLVAYDLGGLVLTAKLVIDDECKDTFVTGTSKIVPQAKLALAGISAAMMDMPRDVFRGLITGRILLDNRIPHESAFASLNSASFSSTATSGSGSLDSQEYKVEAIFDARDNNGEMEYQIKWEGYNDTTWEAMDLLLGDDEQITCLDKFQDFYTANPTAPRYSRASLSKRLIPISEEQEHIIYMHAFVHVGSNNMFEHPTTNQLLQIVEGMEYYMKEFPQDHPEYDTHLLFVTDVDNPHPSFNINANGWDPQCNLTQRLKKHLRKSRNDNSKNLIRESLWNKHMIPNLRKSLEYVPTADRDQPHPRPWFEVGLTVNPRARMKQHANHSLTTCGLAFLECISFALFNTNSPRWVYQPIARARRPEDVPWLESFMTKLLRAAFYEGGVNIEAAGISMTAASKMTIKEISKACDTINWAIFDENLKWHQDRFELIAFVLDEPERDQMKRDQMKRDFEEAKAQVATNKLARKQTRMALSMSVVGLSEKLKAIIAWQEKRREIIEMIGLLKKRQELVEQLKQLAIS